MKAKKKINRSKTRRPISDYDTVETSAMIDTSRPLRFEDLGLKLPALPPTQVVSIRLPSALLNELKAISSERDIPYQSLIKLMLSRSVSRFRKTSAA